MIRAGKVDDIRWAKGTWLILDIGFSSTKKSCGFLDGEKDGEVLTFDEAVTKVIEIAERRSTLNLLIEAPLSVAFDKAGNPKSRLIEKSIDQNNKQILRPWYYGPGCAVMVATMYLLSALRDSCHSADITLFEGFVSFKNSEGKSDHLRVVQALRNAIKIGDVENFYGRDRLKDGSYKIQSAFKVMNMRLGVPAVIKTDS